MRKLLIAILLMLVAQTGCHKSLPMPSETIADKEVDLSLRSIFEIEDYGVVWKSYVSPEWHKKVNNRYKAINVIYKLRKRVSIEDVLQAPRNYNQSLDRVRILLDEPIDLKRIDGTWKLEPQQALSSARRDR